MMSQDASDQAQEFPNQSTSWKLDGPSIDDSTMDSSGMEAYVGTMQMELDQKKVVMDVMSFDENRIPPDLQTAYTHSDCNRFGYSVKAFDDSNVTLCPCCCSVKREPYKLCQPAIQLDNDGPVIPQFFYLSQNLVYLCSIIFLLAMPIQFWIISDNCSAQEGATLSKCDFSLKVFLDSGLVTTNEYYDKFSRFYFIIIWSSVLAFFLFFHKREALLTTLIRKRKPFVSGYTMMVHDIEAPHDTDISYLKEVLEELQREGPDNSKIPLQVSRLEVGKFEGNIDHHLRLIEEKYQTAKTIKERLANEADKRKIRVLKSKLKVVEKQLKAARSGLNKVKGALSNPRNGFGTRNIAFVVLQDPQMAKSINTTSLLRWSLSRVFPCCYKRKVHFVEPATEPDDVNWPAIGYSFFTRLRASFLSYTAFFFVLLLCFSIQFGSRVLAAYLQNQPQTSKNLKLVYGLIPAISGQLLNLLLVSFTMYLSQFERKLSQSEYLLTLTRKLIYMQFFNAAGFPLLMSFIDKQYGGVDNLSGQIFNTLLTNIILNPLLHIFNPGYFIGVFQRMFICMKFMTGSEVLMTQKELNMMFAPPEMSMHVRYASVVRTFFISCFYLEIVPSAPLLCALFMCFQYLIDKYMVVCRYARMIRLHETLSYGVSEIAELSAFFIVLGHVIFGYRYLHTMANHEFKAFEFIFDVVFLGVALFLAAFGITTFYPVYSITRKQDDLGKLVDRNSSFASLVVDTEHLDALSPEMQEGSNSYEAVCLDFETDYDRANPITKNMAMRSWATAKYGVIFPDEQIFETAAEGYGAYDSPLANGGDGAGCINPFADELVLPAHPGQAEQASIGAVGDQFPALIETVTEGSVGDSSVSRAQSQTNLASSASNQPRVMGGLPAPANSTNMVEPEKRGKKHEWLIERLLNLKVKMAR
jgi:hypothetical protein